MSSIVQLRSLPGGCSRPIDPADPGKVRIGQALIDKCSFEEAQTAILAHAAAASESAYVITPNAQHIVLLDKDSRLREIYSRADLVVPDGVSLLVAARILGHSFKERVTGVDLFQSLCARAAELRRKVLLLGGRPGSSAMAAARLRERHPDLNVESYCPPIGWESDSAELDRLSDFVRAAGPSLVFVGFGAPLQEYWIYDHGLRLGANVLIGIGGSFDVVSGLIPRAPGWLRKLGCEWLYRLCREPGRLWRRYLIGNPQFLKIVLDQLVRESLTRLLWRTE